MLILLMSLMTMMVQARKPLTEADSAALSENIYHQEVTYYPHQGTLSIKTNVVSYALLIANIGLEVGMGSNLSFHLPVYYGALDYFRSDLKFRAFIVQPELRYWYPRVKGLFCGVHAGMAFYNICYDLRWRYQDADRHSPAWGGGISVGYRSPIRRRNPQWFWEASIGIGIYDVRYDEFHMKSQGRMTAHNKHTTYYGPDMVNFTLGYTFDWCKLKKMK